jgi:ferredoxin-NADP reductase
MSVATDLAVERPTQRAEPLRWQRATVARIRQETHRVRTFTLALPDWRPHRAGQHYDLRLTAEDGYQAQRSYSIASEPSREGDVDLTIERIEAGEVSPYMHDVVVPGDLVEVRGPIGGYFVWEPERGGPLLLIAGGSGVVPLMAMVRTRSAAADRVPARLLYSSREPDDVIYADELQRLTADSNGFAVIHSFTRAHPPGWKGYTRRIDAQMIGEVARPLGGGALVYICGPTALVEAAANAALELGIRPDRIRTERFGPSGT